MVKKHTFDDPLLDKIDPSLYVNIINATLDMNTKQYSLDDLSFLLENSSLTLYGVLVSQRSLSADFCAKYFLHPSDKYVNTEMDEDMCVEDILLNQPHLTRNSLDESYDKYYG